MEVLHLSFCFYKYTKSPESIADSAMTRRRGVHDNGSGLGAHESPHDDSVGIILFAHLLFMQMYATLLYYAYWISDCELGTKDQEIKRNRKPFDEQVGSRLSNLLFRRTYRVTRITFDTLHRILEPRLDEIFFPRGGNKRKGNKPHYFIDTKTRLSIALRYFAGASVYDIMLVHDISMTSVYLAVWGVLDAINTTKELEYKFPNHEEQKNIARGFGLMSGVRFDKVIGAIDGLIICCVMPPLKFCRALNCGQINFRCHRKDKYGLNLQAICDHMLRFYWAEIEWPAATSDYMAWVTSSLYRTLEKNSVTKIILEGFTIVGDNAYVRTMFMATPLKGICSGSEDGYNFFHSQLRITIERAFGVLVHRWAILRAPLMVPLPRIAPLMEALIRLHNFCINEGDVKIAAVRGRSEDHLANVVKWVKNTNGNIGGADSELVHIGPDGRPSALLGHGHHFRDAVNNRVEGRASGTPMEKMIAHVATFGKEGLRPKY